MIEFDDGWYVARRGAQGTPYVELLERSMIGVASSSISFSMIHDNILAEGINCLTINSKGELLHLIYY